MNRRIFGAAVAAVVIACMALSANAAEDGETAVSANKTAVYITDSGIRVDPPNLPAGSTDFTIVNKTKRSRGLVIHTTDPGGTTIFRYSSRVQPGQSGTMNFWLYPGRAYYLKDYTSMRLSGNKQQFTSHHRTILRMPAQAGFGRGPAVKPAFGVVTVTDDGLETPTLPSGSARLKIVNDSSKTRGIAIIGEDRAGTPTIRHSKMLKPGERAFVNAWFYDGRSYIVKDFTASTSVPGEGMRFLGDFSETMNVPEKIAAVH